MSGDYNNDFNNDFSHPSAPTVFIGSAQAGELIDYIFEFPSKGAAQQDPIIGPYFSQFLAGLGPDVLIFDRSLTASAIPILDYWVMISQSAPFNGSLLFHPNVELVINRTQEILGNASVLLNFFFPDVTRVSIMLSGIGQHTAAGLFGVQKSIKPSPIVGYITEDGTQLYVSEDGTVVYIPEEF